MLKLLTKFKRCTKYLGIEPTSLARERYYTTNPGFESNIVTTGGSGFGLMTIAGVDRGFVPRAEAVSRLTTRIFLKSSHGAPHWMEWK
jgi:hypothetical protein